MSKYGPSQIKISGARVHNLKNIDVVLPRLRLIAITGLSGSGKSSLAFDTLYAEGQRRYVESLSTYARQFLEQMSKPDVEAIEGLSPAISIEQKTVSHNPRSTVGTVTEIYDYLRLLFARAGDPHCPNCNKPITSQTVQEIVDRVLNLPSGSRFSVLAPVVRGQKGEHLNLLKDLLRQGYSRVSVDGQLHDLEEKIKLDKNKKHNIEVYVDRLAIKKGVRTRLTDSVETAIGLAEGLVKITPVEGDDTLFSERHACIDCGISLPEVSPRLFSFNSPQGACPECDGLGNIRFVDPKLVVPDSELGLSQGAIAPWGEKHSGYQRQMLETLAKHYHFSMNTAFGKLTQAARRVILFGSGDVELNFKLKREGMSHKFRRPFEGVIPNLERRFRETTSDWMRAEIGNYMATKKCGQCRGRRLRPEALSVLIGNKSIADLTKLSVVKAASFFSKLKLAKRQANPEHLRQ